MRHTAGTNSCPNEGVEMSGNDPKNNQREVLTDALSEMSDHV
jgi:hypothetical protein